jgi:hypothetical protein
MYVLPYHRVSGQSSVRAVRVSYLHPYFVRVATWPNFSAIEASRTPPWLPSRWGPLLLKLGCVTEKMLEEFHACYQDPHYWTSVIKLGTQAGREPTMYQLSISD